MRYFETPEMEIKMFFTDNIVTTSGEATPTPTVMAAIGDMDSDQTLIGQASFNALMQVNQ